MELVLNDLNLDGTVAVRVENAFRLYQSRFSTVRAVVERDLKSESEAYFDKGELSQDSSRRLFLPNLRNASLYNAVQFRLMWNGIRAKPFSNLSGLISLTKQYSYSTFDKVVES